MCNHETLSLLHGNTLQNFLETTDGQISGRLLFFIKMRFTVKRISRKRWHYRTFANLLTAFAIIWSFAFFKDVKE